MTSALGVHGWQRLDPVLLAALALEAPLLLVGPHGTAKSLVVERVARAVGSEFRHYNASLLNYDDLVGIPLPDESGRELRFVSTPGSIWDAEFVFFDEVSRCRADLQNKLFPIVHERRVAGLPLEGLRHRWAAMNPPAPEDPDDAAALGDVYLGAEPLDPALADRFAFIVCVPGWEELTKEERRALVAGGEDDAEIPDLRPLVARCRELDRRLEPVLRARFVDYVIALVDQLRAAGFPVSPRRARVLARSIGAVHAARVVLEGESAELEESSELALTCGLPQTAGEAVPSPIAVRGAHRQAWEVSALGKDTAWRRVLEEPDPVERVRLADRLSLCDRDLARLVTQALGAQDSEARRVGLATAMFLTFRETRELTPAAWEPLVQLARRVLEPREVSASVSPGRQLETWRELNAFVADPADRVTPLERNFLLGGFPDLWQRCDWRVALGWLRADLQRLGVTGEELAP